MIDGVIVTKLAKNSDDRGWLAEIYRSDETEYRPAMSYVSQTKPGIARGPHEHTKQTDFFAFVGPGEFQLVLYDNRKDSPTYQEQMEIMAGESNPCSVLVPPGVIHGYKCVSQVPGQVVNLANELYKGKNKKEEVDEIRWEDRENAPFEL